MKAIRFHDYGGPEVMRCEELPSPVPRADELRVRVKAMGVNPVDWKIREGHVRERIRIPLPATPGGDIAGVVDAVGSDVTGFAVGDSVYAMIGLLGGYAEEVIVKATMVAHKPARASLAEAASVPLAALTAWQALFEKGGLVAGQTVLVHAAAGGVGMFAVQFARQVGARVVGTCSPVNAQFVRGLGAADVIDYRSGDFSGWRGQFDLVLDSIGGETGLQSLALLKAGGALVGVAPPSEALHAAAAAARVRAMPVMVHPDGAQLASIAALIDRGEVVTSVAATFPLAAAGDAHAMSKLGHTRGKIVLLGGE